MSTVYQVTVDIKKDGVREAGFPMIKSVTVTESKGKQVIQRADASGTYTELPLQELAAVNVLLVTADQAFALRFNDQSDSDLPVNADGLVLLIDAAIPSGASNKVALENASGSTANVTVVSGGS